MPVMRLRRSLARVEAVAVLAAGAGAALRGASYLPPLAPEDVPSLSFLVWLLPLSVYAVLWLAVLPMSVVAVFVRPLWAPAMAAVAGLSALWCVGMTAAWLLDDARRGWVGALSYGVIAVLIGCLVRVGSLADRLAALTEPRLRGR